ncbi:MAG: alpha/beta hydrolase [Phaeodactylibacter sp.]|nr:alpha/beta hydrolase [Phaeodactylibacter sp.]
MKSFVTILIFACTITTVLAQQEIPLYHGAIPNARPVPDPERTESREVGGRAVFDTAIPTLTVFRPQQPNGKAVIICPGGGYAKTALDKEGMWVAEILLEEGITAFVLKYRIPQDLTNVDRSLAPLQDAQQAIRRVRKEAATYGIDPNKIGIMGFSAGGHLAASAATHFQKPADFTELDTTSLRPDFVALIYPVISFTEELTHRGSRNNLIGTNPSEAMISHWSAEQQVGPNTPPAFLVHAADDRSVPVGNSLAFYTACLQHGVPVEMHLYPAGGHGFGLNNPTTEDVWMDRLRNWLRQF